MMMISPQKYAYAVRVEKVMRMYLEYKERHRGVTDKYIWQNVIYPTYCISLDTFYSYKGINYKKIMREYEHEHPRRFTPDRTKYV